MPGRWPGGGGMRGEPAGVTRTLPQHTVRGNRGKAIDGRSGVLARGNKSLSGCYDSCSPWPSPLGSSAARQVLRAGCGSAPRRCCSQLPEGSWEGAPRPVCASRDRVSRPEGVRGVRQAKVAAPWIQGAVVARRKQWSGSNVGGQQVCLVHGLFLVESGRVEVEEQVI